MVQRQFTHGYSSFVSNKTAEKWMRLSVSLQKGCGSGYPFPDSGLLAPNIPTLSPVPFPNSSLLPPNIPGNTTATHHSEIDTEMTLRQNWLTNSKIDICYLYGRFKGLREQDAPSWALPIELGKIVVMHFCIFLLIFCTWVFKFSTFG